MDRTCPHCGLVAYAPSGPTLLTGEDTVLTCPDCRCRFTVEGRVLSRPRTHDPEPRCVFCSERSSGQRPLLPYNGADGPLLVFCSRLAHADCPEYHHRRNGWPLYRDGVMILP